MSIRLDPLEQRIIGVLIEKQLAVPDTYPLTVNALVAGCNQKSNRSPAMEVFDYEAEGALRALMDRNWIARVERDGSRVMRFGHQAKEQLGVDDEDLAILAELLCRGPQSPGELKTRCARMASVGSVGDVEARLQELAERPVPYVVRLPRRPREKMKRWCHLLDGRTPDEAVAGSGDAAALEVAPDTTPPASPVTSAPIEARTPPATGLDIADLVDRVELLEAQVDDLTQRLDRLEGR